MELEGLGEVGQESVVDWDRECLEEGFWEVPEEVDLAGLQEVDKEGLMDWNWECLEEVGSAPVLREVRCASLEVHL